MCRTRLAQIFEIRTMTANQELIVRVTMRVQHFGVQSAGIESNGPSTNSKPTDQFPRYTDTIVDIRAFSQLAMVDKL